MWKVVGAHTTESRGSVLDSRGAKTKPGNGGVSEKSLSSSSRRDLVESRQFLRKVWIDVEGSRGPYYWKQRIRIRIKEGQD